MKSKLFFLLTVFSCITLFSQFTTGTVPLPTTGMTVKIDTNPTTVTLTLTGDSSSMLAIGFNASNMADLPDGFIYNTTANRDYRINNYTSPTADAVQDWTEISNTVSGTTRTIVATRSLSGGTGDYLFTNSSGSLNIIYARKSGTSIGYHGNLRDATTVTFSTLGVDEISQIKNSFKISQNPVKDILEFNINAQVKSINIFDFSGKKLKFKNTSDKNINVSELQKGSYFVEVITANNGSFFEKFIKN